MAEPRSKAKKDFKRAYKMAMRSLRRPVSTVETYDAAQAARLITRKPRKAY